MRACESDSRVKGRHSVLGRWASPEGYCSAETSRRAFPQILLPGGILGILHCTKVEPIQDPLSVLPG